MLKSELLRRHLMLLCFGSAFLLLVVQWQGTDSILGSKEGIKREEEEEGVRGKGVERNLMRNSTFDERITPKSLTVDSLEGKKLGLANRVSLVVDLSDRKVNIYQNNKLKASYSVAVGQEGWQTPTGSFQVLQMQKNPVWRHPITNEVVLPGPTNPLGVRWIGFWWDERHSIGFHGTNQKEGVGQAVSHGCLRMRNQDIEALYELVTIGTSVTIKR